MFRQRGLLRPQNKGSRLCLDSKGAPPPPPQAPPLPSMRTCAPGSPAAHLKFCDTALSMAARAEALVARPYSPPRVRDASALAQLTDGCHGMARSSCSRRALAQPCVRVQEARDFGTRELWGGRSAESASWRETQNCPTRGSRRTPVVQLSLSTQL